MEKMKIKLQFKRKDNGVVEKFELTSLDASKLNVMSIFTMDGDGKSYAWPLGSYNIFERAGNVLCARFVEVEYLRIEYVNA